MFKNPLKYQQGGQLNEQQQQMLAAFIDWLPKRVKEFQGMQPDAIVQALDGMSKTPEGQKQVQQLMEQFQQELQSVPSAKRGGKIQDFICKHGRGGAVAGCGCEKPVEKHQQENGKGRGIIGALSGLYNRFVGQSMPDVSGVNNRRVRTWTDANGIQHIVEDANVNGNSTVTTIDINGADTLGTQKITTGDGRYRMVNLQPGTPQWRSVMSRNVPQQENGGKVEKAQWGGITTGNERTNANNRGQYWEDLTINPEFGRTYRLTLPGWGINEKMIRHEGPNGTIIKSRYSLMSEPSVRWVNVTTPNSDDYEWKNFYSNHMKNNIPQRLSNAQRLVPPMYDIKK